MSTEYDLHPVTYTVRAIVAVPKDGDPHNQADDLRDEILRGNGMYAEIDVSTPIVRPERIPPGLAGTIPWGTTDDRTVEDHLTD